MVRTIIPRMHKTAPAYETLAVRYYEKGYQPEQAIEALKNVNYTINTQQGPYIVDAVTVANIMRGLAIAHTWPKKRTTNKEK